MNNIDNYKSSKFIIYSDFKSVLLALQNKDTSTPLITKLLNKVNTLSKNNSIVLTFEQTTLVCMEIKGLTKLQKKALLTDMFNTEKPYTDLKPTINKFIHDE